MKPVAGSECQSGFNPCSRDGQESFSLPLSLGNVAAEELPAALPAIHIRFCFLLGGVSHDRLVNLQSTKPAPTRSDLRICNLIAGTLAERPNLF